MMRSMQRTSSERVPIPRMVASSALVLAPVILLAFEPDGMAHPFLHQLRSLLSVWFYTLVVVGLIHAVTEAVARTVDRRGGDGLSPRALTLGVVLSLVAVLAFSIPAAPVLAAVCEGIAGHEMDLTTRGVLLGAVYAIVGIAFGRSQRAWLAAQMRTERAERAAIEAKLSAVTARTQPHFLANALNTIAETVRTDPQRAEQLIEDLGGLFSHALSGASSSSVALSDELRAAESYLAVQAARFGDRLRFEVRGAQDCEDAVPAMSILPLVENAVLHGLSLPGSRLFVQLDTALEADRIVVRVTDDGPGPRDTKHRGHGKGLRDLTERLALAFGEERARFLLTRTEASTVAELILPRVMA